MSAGSQAEAENLLKTLQMQVTADGATSAKPDWSGRVASAGNHRSGQLRKLSAALVGPSRFANRQPFNWETKKFKDFKEAILATAGNVQPILVRPAAPGGGVDFEVVFGHRRHRACLDLNLPVLAFVEPLDDRELVLRMVSENIKRQDCSPYEQGCQLKRAFDEGIFSSHREMEDVTRLDHSSVSRLIKLAELPEPVVQAFRSPADLQVKWGAFLHRALADDREGVLRRAEAIRSAGGPADKKKVLELLVGAPREPESAVSPRRLTVKRGREVKAFIDVPPPSHGEGITVRFLQGAVNAEKLQAVLMKLVAETAT